MVSASKYSTPGEVHFVTLRAGVGRSIFATQEQYNQYIEWLWQLSAKLSIDVHAWSITSQKVHFLLTPYDTHAIAYLMKSIGTLYVDHVSRGNKQADQMWTDKYNMEVVPEGDVLFYYWLTECSQYEINEIASLLHQTHSSFRYNGDFHKCVFLQQHPDYLVLGSDPQARVEAYLDFTRRENLIIFPQKDEPKAEQPKGKRSAFRGVITNPLAELKKNKKRG